MSTHRKYAIQLTKHLQATLIFAWKLAKKRFLVIDENMRLCLYLTKQIVTSHIFAQILPFKSYYFAPKPSLFFVI